MKKFCAALGALAIVGMVAVGCEGKQPKVEDSITVKQSGKDVTALTLNIGDKVAIATNAASAPNDALIVVAKPSGFTVTQLLRLRLLVMLKLLLLLVRLNMRFLYR